MEPLMLTPEEVAEALRVSRSRVFQLIGSGQLASVKLGRARRIPKAAVSEFVEHLDRESDPRPAG